MLLLLLLVLLWLLLVTAAAEAVRAELWHRRMALLLSSGSRGSLGLLHLQVGSGGAARGGEVPVVGLVLCLWWT